MGQSLSKLYIHLVFATKFRQPFITSEVEPELHAYIVGILNNIGNPAIRINSMPDHIHILFRLSKNDALAKVVEIVKKNSSKFMKAKGVSGFTWQGGYGAFSVSHYKVETVKAYIDRQKEHHKKVPFKKELEHFVKVYDMQEYEEEFFWR